MLRTIRLSELAPKAFKTDYNKVVGSGSGRANRTVVNLSKNKKSKKLTHMPNIGVTNESNFLIFNAKKAINYLWLVFIKAPILQYFDLESYIRIETDGSGYIIDGVLSQLNLDFDASPNELDLNKSDFSQ